MPKHKHFLKSPPVYILDKRVANEMLTQWHYLGPVRGIILALGHSEGVLVFTNLRSRNLEKKFTKMDLKSIELARMAAYPDHK